MREADIAQDLLKPHLVSPISLGMKADRPHYSRLGHFWRNLSPILRRFRHDLCRARLLETADRLAGTLSIPARLLLASSVILSVLAGSLLVSATRSGIEVAARELAQRAEGHVDILVPALIDQVITGDYQVIRDLLEVRASRPDVTMVGFTNAQGASLTVKGTSSIDEQTPDWFENWVGLNVIERERRLEVGGTYYGVVFVELDPRHEVAKLWAELLHRIELVLLGVGVLLGTLLAVVTAGMRPLFELSRVAERFGHGDYSVRVMERGPPEMVATAHTFNLMAANIERLVGSLRQSDARNRVFATIVAQSHDAIIAKDLDGQITAWNPAAERMFGYSAAEAIGSPVSILHCPEDGNQMEKVLTRIRSGLSQRHEARRRTKDGHIVDIEASVAPQFDEDGRHLGEISITRDVTESRRLAKELYWQATHDSLTGLRNRRYFEQQLNRLVTLAREGQGPHALVCMDLDQFKVVNDTSGHFAGDRMLCDIAELFQRSLAGRGLLARLGGDEFGILMEDIGVEQCHAIVDELRRTLVEFRFAWNGRMFSSGGSFGIVAIEQGTSLTAAELLGAADSACFSAKEEGRNRVQIFRPGEGEFARRQLEMEWVPRINQALALRRFQLMCQVIEPLSGGLKPIHEVLVRMIDESGQMVPPMAFIPAAERYGLMSQIDRLVITTTFDFYVRNFLPLPEALRPQLSINLSGGSLSDPGFLEHVRIEYLRHGVPAGSICFEITETSAIQNLQKAIDLIAQLRELGCRFALDDFGSGFSSFGYLKQLPVDFLKIDGTFVKDMLTDPIDCAMVEAIHRVGQVLGMHTIAEFVDGPETRTLLARIGIDYAQGFGVGKPRPIQELADELRSRSVAVNNPNSATSHAA
ncbi:MAG: hypothetical protein AMXMBFR6_06680 [Betaproteobacteria bacterium]